MKNTFDAANDQDDEIEPISKSQLKREMHALQALSDELTQLNADQLALIPLTAELERAVNETKNIKKREALRRHRQYLGKLMRAADHEAIAAAIHAIKDKQDRLARSLHVMEQWRDDLIQGDDSDLHRFIDTFPSADRQQLRQLVRNAQIEAKNNKPPANARKLFRFIRELMADRTD